MGLFEYVCSNNHVTEVLVPLAQRPQTTHCGHDGCGKEARFVLSAAPTTFRAMDRKAFKRRGH
jgi:hypothetical protein